ncbi:MAG: NAD(P) transhydrogenase subunit alpha [Methylacidiphilales bacterium]|nr:NAD(P) transhydrogenase subunit alpha [Candidatus Methylacidiphilales bacterium]
MVSKNITIAVLAEQDPLEHRIAIVPSLLQRYLALGASIAIEQGAWRKTSISDASWQEAQIVTRDQALREADIVIGIQALPESELTQLKAGTIMISLVYPDIRPTWTKIACTQKLTVFALERMPRISRAQSMDVLSSQASCAGYVAVIKGASLLQRYLPMLTSAAGTIKPAQVLVLGVGVAGLQAIATAKRLGAQVRAFDVRPSTKEQIESLGAKAIDLGISGEGSGGYARVLTDAEQEKITTVLTEEISKADLIITCAGVPGKPAPRLITAAMITRMKQGAVIVDTMAEQGGNCELTSKGTTISQNTITICGETHLPSRLAQHASELFSKNIFAFLSPLFTKQHSINIDWNDELYTATALCHQGEITKS